MSIVFNNNLLLNEENVMNLKKLSLAIITTGLTTSAMANIATSTGDTLTKVSDSIYTSLSGKGVHQKINHPVSLYDYSQTDSQYEDAYIAGNLTAKNNANQTDKNSGKKMDASYDVLLDTSYDKVYSSADSNTSFAANANASIKDSGVPGSDVQDNWGIDAKATYDQYFTPGSNGAFWFGEGDIAFTQKTGDNYGGFKNPKANVTGGLGYGRVVNVTPMAQAIRVVEGLIESGVLQNTPSPAVYKKIATVVSKKSEYKSKYGASYAQNWIKDVEAAIGQNLGARGALKMYDVLENENISARRYGWNVRAGLGASLSTFSGINKKIRPTLKAGANYYYPVGLQTQFSNEATFSTVLDDNDNTYTVNNNMGLTYEMSDRVDWINSWKIGYVNQGDNDLVNNNLQTTFAYDVSNAMTLNTSLALAHQSLNGNNSDVDAVFTTGIKYKLK